jgi:hypothetical protein
VSPPICKNPPSRYKFRSRLFCGRVCNAHEGNLVMISLAAFEAIVEWTIGLLALPHSE